MKDAGFAHMGVGVAKGAGKAENAAKAAISSPLLETSIAGARGVIINITSSPDIGLEDVETAAGLITQSAHPDANIIWVLRSMRTCPMRCALPLWPPALTTRLPMACAAA